MSAAPSVTAGFAIGACISSTILLFRCNEGSPAQPYVDAAVTLVASDAGGPTPSDATPAPADATAAPAPRYAACDDAAVPTFPSLFSGVFATASCGIGSPYDCHSSTGALPRAEGGTGSLLDFSLDASTVFAELLGDGSGFPATNIMGTAQGMLRIAPGDPDASLLYIKLAMPTASDPRYGEAMPLAGLVCPPTLEAVREWIADGASPE